ncbi:hypothetical protein [Rhodanobacter sp. DHG33]|uniref:hypothetical protein n=1 Tax=Rhodanobacter sp. DHG33 TaxID=2775921 RepID=UPI00177F3122|nr:hypothetical protein [Rhodanobacter sp. DHG33]MBD8898367.1 hypothetical protein [Rhodanobacter sp. DHG33]
MKPKNVAVVPEDNSVATVHQVLGEWPEDVIASLETASNALRWIGAILNVASKQEMQGPHSDAADMLSAARYIAMDFANLADCQCESLSDHLREHVAKATELSL